MKICVETIGSPALLWGIKRLFPSATELSFADGDGPLVHSLEDAKTCQSPGLTMKKAKDVKGVTLRDISDLTVEKILTTDLVPLSAKVLGDASSCTIEPEKDDVREN